jgi:RND family efflux transporter MFP subunit
MIDRSLAQKQNRDLKPGEQSEILESGKLDTAGGERREIKNSESETVAIKRPAKFNFWILALILVAFCGLIVFGALPRMAQQKNLVSHTQAQLARTPSVSVVIAQPGPPIEEFTLPGNTQAIDDAPIYARVDGYLHARYVDIGDVVTKGQVLALIDTPELDQQVQAAKSAIEQAAANLDNTKQTLEKSEADVRTASANVAKAKSDLEYFKTELGRYTGLATQGAASIEERDTRKQAYDGGVANLEALESTERSTLASVNSAKAAVHVAQAALNSAKYQYEQVQATRSFRKVTAPFAGIITKRSVDTGSLITSGSNTGTTLMFEVANTNQLRVWINVPEQYVSYMHVGQEAKLNFQAYPGRDFIGTVSNVSGGLDTASKTLQVEINVPNPLHTLLPGEYASVRFQTPAQIRLASVPATTVQTRADGTFAYTVDDQNRLHMHKLQIGRDLGGQIEAVKGIAAGDRVVVSPADDLQDGTVVTPVLAPVASNVESKGGK